MVLWIHQGGTSSDCDLTGDATKMIAARFEGGLTR